MTWWKRVALSLAISLICILITTGIEDFRMSGSAFSHAYGLNLLIWFMLLLPVWLLALPLVLYLQPVDLKHAIEFICMGAMLGSAVITSEIVFHYVHARGFPFPKPSWYFHEAPYPLVSSALGCLTYVLIFQSVERHRKRIQPTT